MAPAGLFTTCIDCWELFDNARLSDKQYELLAIKLEVEKTRLLIWGDAQGILEERPSEAFIRRSSIHSVVHRILKCINTVFEDSNALVERYGVVRVDGPAIEAVAEHKLVTLSSRQMNRFRSVKKRLRITKREEPAISLVKGARWAVKDRQRFSDLVDDLRQYIDGLKAITETSQGPQEGRRMIYEEIQTLPDTADVELLIKATTDTHKDWHDCATEVLEMSVLGDDHRAEIVGWLARADPEVDREISPVEQLIANGFDATNATAERSFR